MADAAPKRVPFPQASEDFGNDHRVSYSKVDNKWILEDDFDGSEWEFQESLGKWIPSVRYTLFLPHNYKSVSREHVDSRLGRELII